MPLVETNINKRVTQSDVARVAGVHNTTVSLSLRNCPSIPDATRKRIREIADQLGYYPDPTLQALVAYRKGRTPPRQRETLAFITGGETRWGWRESAADEQIYLGAQRKSADLGYQLEHFWLGEPGMSARRLSSVLFHRNISGVLLASGLTHAGDLLGMDWSRLSAVKVGCFPREPELNRVLDDHGSMMRLALRRARGAGFERVGLVVDPLIDATVDLAWSATFVGEQALLSPELRIPVLVLPRTVDRPLLLSRWHREHRPDAIVGCVAQLPTLFNEVGLDAPREVAVIDLCLDGAEPTFAGVRQNSGTTGEVAVASLVAQVQQNIVGLPAVATTTLVSGTWIDGASFPSLCAADSWAERSGEGARMPVAV